MANLFKLVGQSTRSRFSVRQQRPMRKHATRFRPLLDSLGDRTLLSAGPPIGDVFYIEMENHNLTQPTGLNPPPGDAEQLQGNPAAPYLNSLMTPGNSNAAETSWASNKYNAGYNDPTINGGAGVHPSEPNYIWQEAGIAGFFNDNDPYPNNVLDTANLSGLLQAAGIPWKSYQEDIDLSPTSGTVNQPGTNALTSTVADQSQWTVPLVRFSGTSSAYTNPYNGSDQYNFAPKHDGQLFFTDTNGDNGSGTPNFSPSNPEAQYYAPLQKLQTDLNNNTVARYSLITPDQYNDMHSSLNTDFTYNGVTYAAGTDQESIALGDNFLSQIVPTIMASQAYKNNGAIVIWYDETENGNTTDYTIPEIVISPLAKGNAYNSTLIYTHSSDLKSMQELFGVSAPGGGFLGDANTPGTNDLSDFFLPSTGVTVSGSTLYLVGGNSNDQLEIKPIGSSQTGSTGIKLSGKLDGSYVSQNVTGISSIYVVGYDGSDRYDFASTLTIPAIVRAGDGNDRVELGDGNNTINLGNGNDRVVAGEGNNVVNIGNGNNRIDLGDGNNTVTAGTGNETIGAGNGTNTVTAGAPGSSGNIEVVLGWGPDNSVTLFGDGNDRVRAGNGNNNAATITGNGNDRVELGDGNNDAATIAGNGNDDIVVGNGTSDTVSMVGNGNDSVTTGTGSGTAHVAGSGNKTIRLGSSGWHLI
jgi:hypothetical protein